MNPQGLVCPRGHSVLEPTAKFCPTCGIAVRCPSGHPITVPGSRFCTVCGTPFPSLERRTPAGKGPAARPGGGRLGLPDLAAVALVGAGVVFAAATLFTGTTEGDTLSIPRQSRTGTLQAPVQSTARAGATAVAPTSAALAIAARPVEPTVAAAATPEAALERYFRTLGIRYAGDCTGLSLGEDVGSYCTRLVRERAASRVYMAGMAFSEGDTWLLVEGSGSGWKLSATAPLDPDGDLVPPWP